MCGIKWVFFSPDHNQSMLLLLFFFFFFFFLGGGFVFGCCFFAFFVVFFCFFNDCFLTLVLDPQQKRDIESMHPRSLISAFVIRLPFTCYKQNIIFLVSPLAEQAGLSLALSEIIESSPKSNASSIL